VSNRDDLRSAILGVRPEFAKEIVEYKGNKFEVRQPTNKARRDLFKKAIDENGKIDMMEFVVWAVIYNTYDPESGKTVFEDTDYDVFINMPSGGVLDKLGEVASRLLNVEESIEKK
jgi:hypothetical protein